MQTIDSGSASYGSLSDVFYGYPGGLDFYLLSCKSEFQQTVAAVRNEYIKTSEFAQSNSVLVRPLPSNIPV